MVLRVRQISLVDKHASSTTLVKCQTLKSMLKQSLSFNSSTFLLFCHVPRFTSDKHSKKVETILEQNMPKCFSFCPMRLISWRPKSNDTKHPVILFNVCKRCEWCIEKYGENHVNTLYDRRVNAKKEAMRVEFVEQLNRMKLTSLSVINLLNESRDYKDKVMMHSDTVQAIITKLASLGEMSSHVEHQLTWLFEDLSQCELDSDRSLQAQCRRYKSDILQLSRHMVICSICLDTAFEVAQTNRSLMSTFCGHIFCDHCIKKAVAMQQMVEDEEPSVPWCPRCRQILQPLRDSNLAHALFF